MRYLLLLMVLGVLFSGFVGLDDYAQDRDPSVVQYLVRAPVETCVRDVAAETHDPITIFDDAQFPVPDAVSGNGVRSGSGTEDDPYVISGWSIEAEPGRPAIRFSDTDSHVVLKDIDIVGTGSPWPDGVVLERVENVTIEGLQVKGYYLTAVVLNDVRGLHISDVRFDAGPRDEPAVGFGIQGVDATIERVIACDVKIMGFSAAGQEVLDNTLEIRNVRLHAKDVLSFTIPRAVSATLAEVEGPIAIFLNLLAGGTGEVRDVDVAAVSVSPVPRDTTEGLTVLVDHVSATHGDSGYSPALKVDTGPGTAHVARSHIAGYPLAALEVNAYSMEIRDNVFDANGRDANGVMYHATVVLRTLCETTQCGPFMYAGNDIRRHANDGASAGIWFRSNGSALTGEGNWFGGDPPVASDEDDRVSLRHPKVGVFGDVRLTDHRSEPNHLETRDSGALTGLVPLAAVLVLVAWYRRPARFHLNATHGRMDSP